MATLCGKICRNRHQAGGRELKTISVKLGDQHSLMLDQVNVPSSQDKYHVSSSKTVATTDLRSDSTLNRSYSLNSGNMGTINSPKSIEQHVRGPFLKQAGARAEILEARSSLHRWAWHKAWTTLWGCKS